MPAAARFLKDTENSPVLTKDSAETSEICKRVKQLEYEGGIRLRRLKPALSFWSKRFWVRKKYFDLNYFKTTVDQPNGNNFSSSAIIKITVGDRTEITAAEGDGPVHALDGALEGCLKDFILSSAEFI